MTKLDNEILRYVRELPSQRVPTHAPQLRFLLRRRFPVDELRSALRDRGLVYVETAGQKTLVVLPLPAVLAVGIVRLIAAALGPSVQGGEGGGSGGSGGDGGGCGGGGGD